eukprot:CAMPEP_0117527554 /NCGR_PEP_ID=MMETSP0784-20121206/36859_1 /TAXON_ID=39447 /ORGANISM="" /LENGTH=106 /DNA_ID=CAMNT_0005323813 /DNA_START=271 /DNA_END=588 /DNA_ORIENTATION=-
MKRSRHIATAPMRHPSAPATPQADLNPVGLWRLLACSTLQVDHIGFGNVGTALQGDVGADSRPRHHSTGYSAYKPVLTFVWSRCFPHAECQCAAFFNRATPLPETW